MRNKKLLAEKICHPAQIIKTDVVQGDVLLCIRSESRYLKPLDLPLSGENNVVHARNIDLPGAGDIFGSDIRAVGGVEMQYRAVLGDHLHLQR